MGSVDHWAKYRPNWQISASHTGTYITASTSPVAVTNCYTPALVTKGGTVEVGLMPGNGASNAAWLGYQTAGGGTPLGCNIYIYRNTNGGGDTAIFLGYIGEDVRTNGGVICIDSPAAGSHVYTLYVSKIGTTGYYVQYIKIFARELM